MVVKMPRNFLAVSKILVPVGLASTSIAGALAVERSVLECAVEGSQDTFVVDGSQLVYQTASFSHFAMIDGLTILVMNRETMRFNRLTNINLLSTSALDPSQPPDAYQFFSGLCRWSPSE